MFVKICAHTNLADAQHSVEAGVDALGFVFAKSSRQVTAAQVAAITHALPKSVKKIGVFHARTADEIIHDVHAAGLTGAQLHFAFDPTVIARLRREFGPDFFLIQTLHWTVDGDAGLAEKNFREQLQTVAQAGSVDAILLDTKTTTASGGTGKSFDWKRARAVLDADAGGLKIIVAGGLTPENVREAIAALHPWGVDVASGTEFMPGMKDAAKIRAFVAAARS
ncbi:MAG TPA: phosphoribosylanthranilate isomerase [Acidobacteriaceae bacterium]|jgi:phosphoribosylanthranilate isomerase|nr:phosphoribosylanthranilate isomerase [Acidobacteriaceae bacterium]